MQDLMHNGVAMMEGLIGATPKGQQVCFTWSRTLQLAISLTSRNLSSKFAKLQGVKKAQGHHDYRRVFREACAALPLSGHTRNAEETQQVTLATVGIYTVATLSFTLSTPCFMFPIELASP